MFFSKSMKKSPIVDVPGHYTVEVDLYPPGYVPRPDIQAGKCYAGESLKTALMVARNQSIFYGCREASIFRGIMVNREFVGYVEVEEFMGRYNALFYPDDGTASCWLIDKDGSVIREFKSWGEYDKYRMAHGRRR